jgi:hypothetical protein
MPNDWSSMPMQMMNLPQKYGPMMEMPQEQLESMFPRCYYIIYPEVCRHCDRMLSKKGTMYTPTREELENMVDDIDNRVGQEVEAEYEDNDDGENLETMGTFENFQKDDDDRQFGFGGGFFGGRRRFRRDLISIILLRELLRRRRRPHYGFGYGYPGGYGWY